MKPFAILGLLMLLLMGCEHSDKETPNDNVELTLRIATSSVDTRGNVSDYPSTPAEWTQAERAVDGRYMYALSVYVLNDKREVVAVQENIAISAGATEAVVTFDKSYNLKRGIYTLMAVANHANHTIGTTTYNSGLSSGWKAGDYQSLMSNMINANSSHNISPKDVVQPLSLMKTIELHSGNNSVEGELVRTFARIRIEVKNNSGTLPLKINGLTFSSNFTQKQAYVFDDGTDRKYFGTTGAPLSTSTHALLPFAYDASGNTKTVDARTSAVVFDGYLLESKLTNENDSYKYTLDLSYEGVEATYSFVPVWTAINQTSGMGVGQESYFLLYNTNRSRYLSAGTDIVTTASLSTSSTTVSTDHVWQLVPTGSNNKYYLLNVETGLYMQNPGTYSITLGTTPVAFTFADKRSGTKRYLLISSGRYVSVNNSNNVVSVTSNNQASTYFNLYKVNRTSTSLESGSISYNTPIVLTTINPTTQQSSPARAIKRNDFINVLVTVSYNSVSGKFVFYVENWNEAGGDVEFN